MSSPEAKRNPVEQLAEEFLDRYRQGERPSLSEYIHRYPELAAEIRDVFPALVMMEEAGPKSGSTQEDRRFRDAGVGYERLGDYRILREVGRGGMGIVYEAEQESLGRHVALKVLPAQASVNSLFLQRFRREARSAARLHHTNIVPVFDVGDFQGIHYYAMQFIQGQGLDEVLNELRRLRGTTRDENPAAGLAEPSLTDCLVRGLVTNYFPAEGSGSIDKEMSLESIAGEERYPEDAPQPLGVEEARSADSPSRSSCPPPSSCPSLPGQRSDLSAQSEFPFYRSVARIGLQVAEALAYAHTQKVLHRDIKPANLLLDRQGTVWITDFGLAKEEGDDLTHTGDLVGTLRYMAPERFRGASDARSDVYSLGLTLFELLTLQPAFADTDRGRLIHRVTHEEPPPPRKLDPRLPRDLETVILKSIAKEPKLRYQTAEELADDLRRFLSDRPIRARRSSPWEHAWRWCRRNPALAAVGGLAATGLLLAAAVSASFGVYYANTAGRLSRALAEADQVTAGLALDRGVALCDQGDTGSGLLWLARSLELAAKARDADLERAARINLSAWGARMHPLRQCLRHQERVSGVAFSPDGTRLVTSCVDGTAQLWDAGTGQPIGGALHHGGAVTAVAFSPDRRHLATACADGKLYRWDATTGASLGSLGDGAPIEKVLFDPRGRWCLTVGGPSVRVWDLAADTALATLDHVGSVTDAAVSRDGATLLTGTDAGSAVLWDLPAGAQRGRPLQRGCLVRSVALHPDGRLAAVGDVKGHTVLWDAVRTGSVQEMPRHNSAVVALAFSPDGEQLLSASRDWRAYLSDVRKPAATPRCKLKHLAPVGTASFSPDGQLVLTGSRDGRGRLWDAASGEPVGQPLTFQAAVHSAVFSADGRSVALAGADTAARVWDVVRPPAPPEPFTYPEGLYAAAFSRDGTLLATAGEGEGLCPIRLWDTAPGQLRRVLPGHRGTVRDLAFSGDGTRLASAGGDGHARVWEVATGKILQDFAASPDWATAVAFSPDGKLLLVGTRPGDVALWDLDAGRPRTQLPRHGGPVVGAAFSPDGSRWLTGGLDLTARLGTTVDGQAVGVPLRHQGQVWSVSFSPDGRLALTGSDDRAVRGWEAETSRPLGAPLVDPFMVRLVQFSPDGRTILKGGLLDGSRLWDVATRKPLGPVLPHPDAVYAAHFAPDGRHVLLAGERLRAARYAVILEAMAGPPERIDLQMRLAAGMELGLDEGLRILDADAWHARRQRFAQMPADR